MKKSSPVIKRIFDETEIMTDADIDKINETLLAELHKERENGNNDQNWGAMQFFPKTASGFKDLPSTDVQVIDCTMSRLKPMSDTDDELFRWKDPAKTSTRVISKLASRSKVVIVRKDMPQIKETISMKPKFEKNVVKNIVKKDVKKKIEKKIEKENKNKSIEAAIEGVLKDREEKYKKDRNRFDPKASPGKTPEKAKALDKKTNRDVPFPVIPPPNPVLGHNTPSSPYTASGSAVTSPVSQGYSNTSGAGTPAPTQAPTPGPNINFDCLFPDPEQPQTGWKIKTYHIVLVNKKFDSRFYRNPHQEYKPGNKTRTPT